MRFRVRMGADGAPRFQACGNCARLMARPYHGEDASPQSPPEFRKGNDRDADPPEMGYFQLIPILNIYLRRSNNGPRQTRSGPASDCFFIIVDLPEPGMTSPNSALPARRARPFKLSAAFFATRRPSTTKRLPRGILTNHHGSSV